MADDDAGGDNWLDNCARAVGDGDGLGLDLMSASLLKVNRTKIDIRVAKRFAEKRTEGPNCIALSISDIQSLSHPDLITYCSCCVGNVTVGDGGGSRANGNQRGDNLGGVLDWGWDSLVVVSSSGCGERSEGDDGELHLGGWLRYYLL